MGKGQRERARQAAAPDAPPALSDFPVLGEREPPPAAAAAAARGEAEQQPLEAPPAVSSVEPLPRPTDGSEEELAARHKRELRELEGRSRAAQRDAKAKGKGKAAAAALAAADEAAVRLRVELCESHSREIRAWSQASDAAVPRGLDDATSGTESATDAATPAAPTSTAGVSGDCSPAPPSCWSRAALPADAPPPPPPPPAVAARASGAASRPPPPPAADEAAPYRVHGSKKGGFPVSVESRSRGKTVTVIHHVSGDVAALLADLKAAVGAGGVVRDGSVEVQGDHL